MRQFWIYIYIYIGYNTFIILLLIHFYISISPMVPSAYSGSSDKTPPAYCNVNMEALTIF